MQRIAVIDSHTAGEPTRIVISGGPDLGPGPIVDRVGVFRERFDAFRSAVVNEPRGHDAVVGALIVPAVSARAVCGVIFFNNVGYLRGCGHGTMGLAVTLAHLGRVGPGRHTVETPSGEVAFELGEGGRVSIDNVPSRRAREGARVDVPGYGEVLGDVAFGGNWFFLTDHRDIPLERRRIEQLTAFATAVKAALVREGVTGDDGGEIDHVELFGPPADPANDARNFVLCPGGAYDRSPCGTGTSAKLACLHAEGKLPPGRAWRQESVIGSVFEGRVRDAGGAGRAVIPTITGSAFVTAESTLLIDGRDPFGHGIP